VQGPIASGLSTAGRWFADNQEYIIAGAVVVAGVAVMATGFGGPIGAGMISGALLSGGISIGTQKCSNGEVNWVTVGRETLIGGIMGGIGAGASNYASSWLLSKSSSARTALATHAIDDAVRLADGGIMAMLNGEIKLAAATRIESATNYNMLVDDFVRGVAGDTFSTMTSANAEYILNATFDPNKDFTFNGFLAANTKGLFESTLSGTLRLGTGGLSIPTDVAPTAPMSDKLGRFARELGTDAVIDPLSNFVGWQVRDNMGGGVTQQDRNADAFNSGFESLGSGLHESFTNLHIGGR